jgi:hypothetical protein
MRVKWISYHWLYDPDINFIFKVVDEEENVLWSSSVICVRTWDKRRKRTRRIPKFIFLNYIHDLQEGDQFPAIVYFRSSFEISRELLYRLKKKKSR